MLCIVSGICEYLMKQWIFLFCLFSSASTNYILIFDKVPKITEVEDQKISETSTCSDEGDDNGVEVNEEIEHQTVLDPQPLTVMKAR